jgi:hypothetical protein
MKGVVKARQYLPVLLWYVKRRLEGGRGFLISIRTRDVCGADKRCTHALRRVMMNLVERGLAKRRRRDVYLIERRAAEEVLTAKKIRTVASVFDMAVDGSEACLSLDPPKAFCAQNGSVKETRLELVFSRYETYEDYDKSGVPPQGPTGLRRGGEGVCKVVLTAFPLLLPRRSASRRF